MRKLYIQTYGCQMNERDSEEILGMLGSLGYSLAARPDEADVVLLNTCSVRERAEEKAYGRINDLSYLKKDNPDVVLGIVGCMAKLHQESVFKHAPAVDLVAGPAELYDLPFLLAEVEQRRRRGEIDRRGSARVMAVDRAFRPLDAKPQGDYRKGAVRAYVSVIEGCDKACTYCIVPKTRGQEISRPLEEIIAEVRALEESGVREVILLGQNVNSYGKRFPDGSGYHGPAGRLRLIESDPESLVDFPQLLRALQRRTNMPRIRFTTSHPFDANDRLFEAMADSPAVCPWLHLPVQSGSNRILRAMRRGYTAEAYLKKIERLRALIPDISFSTDIIVGFPGETDRDFEDTARLMEAVGYDSAYIFKYSPRPGTDAAAKEDSVPQAVKEARNQRLLQLQDRLSMQKHQALVGRTLEVLFEEPGKRPGQWFGRTGGNHGVIVEHTEALAGRILPVTVTDAQPHTLFGEALIAPTPLSD